MADPLRFAIPKVGICPVAATKPRSSIGVKMHPEVFSNGISLRVIVLDGESHTSYYGDTRMDPNIHSLNINARTKVPINGKTIENAFVVGLDGKDTLR